MAGMIGYSPELMEEEVTRLGGLDPATTQIQDARLGMGQVDPRLSSMSPEDRAALDRYTNFAQLAQQSNNPIQKGANFIGGMGAMGLTELLKLVPSANTAASKIWNRGRKNAKFFGGKDVSQPSLSNLASAYYGFTRKPKTKKNPVI